MNPIIEPETKKPRVHSNILSRIFSTSTPDSRSHVTSTRQSRSSPSWSNKISPINQVSPLDRQAILQNKKNLKYKKKKRITNEDDNSDCENENKNVQLNNLLFKSTDLKHKRRGFIVTREQISELKEIHDANDRQKERDEEEDISLHGLRKTDHFPLRARKIGISIGLPRIQLKNIEQDETILREELPIVSIIHDDKIHENLSVVDYKNYESEAISIDDGGNESTVYDDESHEESLPRILRRGQAVVNPGTRRARFNNQFNKIKRAISPLKSRNSLQKIKQKTIIRKKKSLSKSMNLGFLSKNGLYREPIPKNIDLILEGYYDETSETRSSSSGSEVFNFPGRRQRQSEENVVDVQKNTRRKLKRNIQVDSDSEDLLDKKLKKSKAGPSKIKYRKIIRSPEAQNSDSSVYCFSDDEMKQIEPPRFFNSSVALFESSSDSHVEINKTAPTIRSNERVHFDLSKFKGLKRFNTTHYFY